MDCSISGSNGTRPSVGAHRSEILARLGITKTHSRPYTSSDHPYNGGAPKDAEYRPEFPVRFDSIEQAPEFGHGFFHWYTTGTAARGSA